MKPTPKGWPRISSSIAVANASAAIDWYCTAFGFEVRLRVEGDKGRIEHCELVYGEGLIMFADRPTDGTKPYRKTPKELGGSNTQSMMIYVDDIQSAHDRAKAAGAEITMPIAVSDYGDDYWTDRHFEAQDPDGHRWYFAQRIKG